MFRSTIVILIFASVGLLEYGSASWVDDLLKHPPKNWPCLGCEEGMMKDQMMNVNLRKLSNIPKPKKWPCLGCEDEISTDDRMMKKSLRMVLAEQNSKFKLVKVLKATQQTTDGYSYKIKCVVKVAGTDDEKTCNVSFTVTAGMEPQLMRLSRFDCK
uniref:Venom cystatin 8 n=1 Tax=Oncocephalus sp. TaxID=2944721 RepID=A0AB38ZES5_9HEMI